MSKFFVALDNILESPT